jgi:hypothetical protein
MRPLNGRRLRISHEATFPKKERNTTQHAKQLAADAIVERAQP